MVYITNLSHANEQYVSQFTWIAHLLTISRRSEIDLEAKFEPSLLNTAIYLLGLSQQVSTFAINYQVRSASVRFSDKLTHLEH
jgi:magnesium-transporting ATPase (P-type)